MPDYITETQSILVAATTSRRLYFAPPDASRKWRLRSINYMPNTTLATHAANYGTIRPYKGDTALAALRTTNSSGGSALTQGSIENVSLTGVGEDREISQVSPLNVRFDGTAGTGAAMDVSIQVEFEEIRT